MNATPAGTVDHNLLMSEEAEARWAIHYGVDGSPNLTDEERTR